MTEEAQTQDVKLPEPDRWLVVDMTGYETVTQRNPSDDPEAWGDFTTSPIFTADQVRAAVMAERERAARVCEELRDLREEARAILQASASLKEGDAGETLRRLRHESDVRLHNGALDRAAAAIRSGS